MKLNTTELLTIFSALSDRLELVTTLAEQSTTAGAEYTGHLAAAHRYQKEAAELRQLIAKIQAELKTTTP